MSVNMTDVFKGHNEKCVDMKRYCRETVALHDPGFDGDVGEICWCYTDFSLSLKDKILLGLLWAAVIAILLGGIILGILVSKGVV